MLAMFAHMGILQRESERVNGLSSGRWKRMGWSLELNWAPGGSRVGGGWDLGGLEGG